MMATATQAPKGQSAKTDPADRPKRILGPREFRATHQIAAAAARLSNHLTETLDLPPPFAARMDMALFELADNALYHGNIPGSNTWHKPTATVTHRPTEGTLTIKVTDKGLGIPATIKRNSKCAPENDCEALLLATIKGISGTGKAERGQGLHTTLETALCEGNTLPIESGSARLTVPPIGPPASLPVPAATGTTVILTVDLNGAHAR